MSISAVVLTSSIGIGTLIEICTNKNQIISSYQSRSTDIIHRRLRNVHTGDTNRLNLRQVHLILRQ